MTLRLYADRKGWPLGTVTVELSHGRMHARDCEECEVADDVMLDIIPKNSGRRRP
jgi:putative redox protein